MDFVLPDHLDEDRPATDVARAYAREIWTGQRSAIFEPVAGLGSETAVRQRLRAVAQQAIDQDTLAPNKG